MVHQMRGLHDCCRRRPYGGGQRRRQMRVFSSACAPWCNEMKCFLQSRFFLSHAAGDGRVVVGSNDGNTQLFSSAVLQQCSQLCCARIFAGDGHMVVGSEGDGRTWLLSCACALSFTQLNDHL